MYDPFTSRPAGRHSTLGDSRSSTGIIDTIQRALPDVGPATATAPAFRQFAAAGAHARGSQQPAAHRFFCRRSDDGFQGGGATQLADSDRQGGTRVYAAIRGNGNHGVGSLAAALRKGECGIERPPEKRVMDSNVDA